jgi:RHS repeat-associated protein
MEQFYENGELISSNVQMGNYTSYPSAFLVVNPDGVYSKHYYAGAQRIAARVGVENADQLFPEDHMRFCAAGSGRTDEELKKIQQADLQYYLTKGGIKTQLGFKEYQPASEKEEEDNTEQTEALPIRATDQIYYYHPDHLGTATYLTDGNGLPYEFFLNLPFGETMAEQHSQTADYENRYKFTGHELDRETGLYYAGARYYDPKISIWLSVDPLVEEAPGWTPYRYGYNNPLRYADPTGLNEEDWIPETDDAGKVSYKAEANDSAKTLSSQYGISQEKAEEITETKGSEEIKEGTKISGKKVETVTGSEVLKLDLNSKKGKSQQ